MKIKVVIPNSSVEFRNEAVDHRKQVAMEGTKVDVVSLPRGPVSMESFADEAYASPYLLDEIKKAEQQGYDAVTIDCSGDAGLRAAKEIANIPVVGAGEASRLLALALGDKFSIITVLPNAVDVIRERVITSQIGDRCASVRSADVPVLELKDYERAKAATLRESKRAVEEDGADVIVLGCVGMAKIAEEIQKELGVPVVEPAAAAIKVAEALVQMKLSHSKRSFKTPPKKEIK